MPLNELTSPSRVPASAPALVSIRLGTGVAVAMDAPKMPASATHAPRSQHRALTAASGRR
jgi:hypothetical protein